MYFHINEGNNKLTTGRDSVYDVKNNHPQISIGEVVSITDPSGMGRIKVYIHGPASRGGDDNIKDLYNSDNTLNIDVLPWCISINPKHLHVKPLLGESVYIFNLNKDKQFVDRLYFGPIISQVQNLSNEPYKFSPLNGISFANKNPDTAIETIPELKGLFPTDYDISIQGRYNTEVTQKNNEIILRAGKVVKSNPTKANPFPFTLNKETQGYLQIKNNVNILNNDGESELGSVTNIVSSKINLLTHKNGSPNFNLNGQAEPISKKEMDEILNTAHPIPFGDILLDYLRLVKDVLLNHVHNGHGNTPTDLTTSGNIQAVANFKAKADELEKALLSKNIKIN